MSESFPLERAAKRSRFFPTESGSTADSSGSTEGNQPHGQGPGLEPTPEDDGTTVRPEELVNPAVGESLDEEVEACSDDYKEPTETQKRELFKIHRDIGHPTPNDFGRALRHAGVHRHLVRWAVKDMRCPVREARVKPQTFRPGALPRCLRFNQVVGMDLVEFPDHGSVKILANML